MSCLDYLREPDYSGASSSGSAPSRFCRDQLFLLSSCCPQLSLTCSWPVWLHWHSLSRRDVRRCTCRTATAIFASLFYCFEYICMKMLLTRRRRIAEQAYPKRSGGPWATASVWSERGSLLLESQSNNYKETQGDYKEMKLVSCSACIICCFSSLSIWVRCSSSGGPFICSHPRAHCLIVCPCSQGSSGRQLEV